MVEETHVGEGHLEAGERGGDSRAAILRAAKAAFANYGFAGARIEEIVKQSGVNVRMIYHYFGNKEGLYEAVIQHEVQRSNDLMESVQGLSPADAVRSMMEQYYDRCKADLLYVKIVLWENILGLQTARTVAGDDPIFFDELIRQIEFGQADGVFKPHMPAIQAAKMMLMALLQCHNVKPNPERLAEMDDMERQKQQIVQATLDIILL